MKIRAGPQPLVQTIFIFLSAAKSNKFLEVFSSFMGGVFGCAFACKWRFVPWSKPLRAKSFSPAPLGLICGQVFE
jgi:hypothetical protein